MLKNGYRTDPKRTDDGASESPARGRWPHGRLRWDRRNTLLEKRGSPLSTCAPRRYHRPGWHRRRQTPRATIQREHRYGQTRESHHSRHVPREARIATQRLSGLWESARPKTRTAQPRAWYYPRRSRWRWRRTDLLQLEINRTLRWCRRK